MMPDTDIGSGDNSGKPDSTCRVPVVLLTGFLGAGKTARLNATLTSGSSRIAVIENEIGALSVDGALVANRHEDGFIELTNGCICCSSEVDLISALEALQRRSLSSAFQAVVIETTGLADVAPVAALLRDQSDPLAEHFRFQGVVTVVDVAHFAMWARKNEGQINEDSHGIGPVPVKATGFGGPELAVETPSKAARTSQGPGREAAAGVFWRQVALADRIILSKVDLAGMEAAEEVRKAMMEANPFAEVIVENGDVASQLVLDGLEMAPVPRSSIHHSLPLCGSSRQRRNAHLVGVDVLTLRVPAGPPLREALLRQFVEVLLAGETPDFGEAWRIKGIVVLDTLGIALLQAVGDQVEMDAWPHPIPEGPFIVVIGERLCRDQIESALMNIRDVPQGELGTD